MYDKFYIEIQKNVELILVEYGQLTLAHSGAGLKFRMKNNQKGFNFNFLRDDSKLLWSFIYRCIKNRKLYALK